MSKKDSKKIIGLVIKESKDNTATVKIDTVDFNKLYKKRFTKSKKYLVGCNNKKYIAGDKVMIESTKPISKRKRYKIISKI